MAKPGTTRVEKHVRSVFPDGAISRVQVLEYGDDPAVEPGDIAVRVFFPGRTRPRARKPTRTSSILSSRPTASASRS